VKDLIKSATDLIRCWANRFKMAERKVKSVKNLKPGSIFSHYREIHQSKSRPLEHFSGKKECKAFEKNLPSRIHVLAGTNNHGGKGEDQWRVER